MRILIDIVEFEELFFNIENMFEDEWHFWIFFKLVKVLNKKFETLHHHLLSQDQHRLQFEFTTQNHVANGSVHEIF